MTGLLVTVSLLCGCVFNADAGIVERVEVSHVRVILDGAVSAIRDAQVRIDPNSTTWVHGTRPLLVYLDRAGERKVLSAVASIDRTTIASLLTRAHPVRAPSFV